MGVKLGVTLTEEHRLRVFENTVLRRIVGHKEEGAGGWRRLHNEELHNLYASPNIRVIKSRRMRWAGHIACTGEIRKAYNILVGKPEKKRKWDDTTKIITGKGSL